MKYLLIPQWKYLKKEIKNVVGVDIKFIKPKNPDLIIDNLGTKRDLYLKYNKIMIEIKSRKIKIY